MGVATSGLRAATNNGAQALAKVAADTGIQLRIVNGDEEALLGYKAVEGEYREKYGTQSHIVVWDIGGGSMQFATRALNSVTDADFIVRSLPVGGTSFLDQLIAKTKRNEGATLSPISNGEIFNSIFDARSLSAGVPKAIRDILLFDKNVQVIGVGGLHCEGINQSVSKTPEYTLDQVIELRWLLAGRDLDWIKANYTNTTYPTHLAASAILVSGMMEALGIRKVRVMDVNLTDGLMRD